MSEPLENYLQKEYGAIANLFRVIVVALVLFWGLHGIYINLLLLFLMMTIISITHPLFVKLVQFYCCKKQLSPHKIKQLAKICHWVDWLSIPAIIIAVCYMITYH